MKTTKSIFAAFLFVFVMMTFSSCLITAEPANRRVGNTSTHRHDNGRHLGWFKHGHEKHKAPKHKHVYGTPKYKKPSSGHSDKGYSDKGHKGNEGHGKSKGHKGK